MAGPISDAMLRGRLMRWNDGGERFMEELRVVATVYRRIYPGAPDVELNPLIAVVTLDDERCYVARIRVHDPRMTDEELAESVANVRDAVQLYAPGHMEWLVEGSNA